MTYVDTSVVLAELLAEDRSPPARLWESDLVSSRLLEYELWTRVHARKLTSTHGDAARAIVARIALLDLSPLVLGRALDPFPVAVRDQHGLPPGSEAYVLAQLVFEHLQPDRAHVPTVASGSYHGKPRTQRSFSTLTCAAAPRYVRMYASCGGDPGREGFAAAG